MIQQGTSRLRTCATLKHSMPDWKGAATAHGSVSDLGFDFNYSLSDSDDHSFIGQHAFQMI